MFDFSDQRVIVTGGTRGIGAGITSAFLHAGATVIATYARNDQQAGAFREQNHHFKDRLDLKKFDVADAGAVVNFFNYLEERYSSVEVLVNNSGIRKDSMLAMMEKSSWDEVLKVNLDGTFLMSKYAVLSFMKKRYGRIINISSIGGNLGLAGQANYAASKAGQVALARALSKEVGKKGITVNSICPGFIDTEMTATLDEELKKEYKRQVPLKRFGTVEEVAHGVLFLASRQASYITGTTLDISGGL